MQLHTQGKQCRHSRCDNSGNPEATSDWFPIWPEKCLNSTSDRTPAERSERTIDSYAKHAGRYRVRYYLTLSAHGCHGYFIGSTLGRMPNLGQHRGKERQNCTAQLGGQEVAVMAQPKVCTLVCKYRSPLLWRQGREQP